MKSGHARTHPMLTIEQYYRYHIIVIALISWGHRGKFWCCDIYMYSKYKHTVGPHLKGTGQAIIVARFTLSMSETPCIVFLLNRYWWISISLLRWLQLGAVFPFFKKGQLSILHRLAVVMIALIGYKSLTILYIHVNYCRDYYDGW